jgi:molybdate transport system substrate-binding protein
MRLITLYSSFVLLLALHVSAQALRIAAAADLQWAMNDLTTAFRMKYPNVRFDAVYGSSGNFVAQIRAGAPFDAFFSADMDYPRALFDAGLASSAPHEYGFGRIVLWKANARTFDLSQGVKLLASQQIRRIAIANPAHAPYGKRAKEYFQNALNNAPNNSPNSAQTLALVEQKCVFGDNVAHAAQIVVSGNADIGVISLSLALAPMLVRKGVYVVIDSTLHTPLRQGAVVIKARPNAAWAEEFVAFVCSADGSRILVRYGFRASDSEAR